MVLALHRNTVKIPLHPCLSTDTETTSTAEFRGPGVRHHFEDSGDDYDLAMDHRNRGIAGRSGRIILLGDGTEMLTNSDDMEMYDHEDEDKDLESQARGVQTNSNGDNDELRNEREETPGPQAPMDHEKAKTPEPVLPTNPFDTPSSTTPEKSESTETNTANVKVIPATVLPEKLVTPTKGTK